MTRKQLPLSPAQRRTLLQLRQGRTTIRETFTGYVVGHNKRIDYRTVEALLARDLVRKEKRVGKHITITHIVAVPTEGD